MFYECFFCNHPFEDNAIAKGYVHFIGKYLICTNCLAELRDALDASSVKEMEEDVEVLEHTNNILLV